MAPKSYTQFVLTQRPRNPSLGNLCHFLTQSISRKPGNITCLSFSDTDESPSRGELSIAELESLLEVLTTDNRDHDSSTNTRQPQGRILFIGDPDKNVIELLGSQLDIDPIFFASHIHGPTVTAQSSKPASVILPSETARQNFLSLQYHRALEFGKESAALRRLSSDGNIQRKVMLLPAMRNTRIGLAQQSCSVLITSTKKGWLGKYSSARIDKRADCFIGLILVDAPLTPNYRSSEQELCLQSESFQGGIEYFIERPSFSDDEVTPPAQTSLMDDLILHWSEKRPPSFNVHSPSLLSMTYCPLKIVAAEWVRYVNVLSLCIKHYEYSTGTELGTEVLAKLDSDLRDLQAWVRRCMQTVQKLQSVINFVELRATSAENEESYNMLVEDYKYIISMVRVYGRRLEAMIPFVTSLVQIVDSRESLREASNVRRLTNLALVFVPLSFVTGLFSMNDGVSAHGLVLFFSVAVPFCIVVVFISRIPYMRLSERFMRLRRLTSPQNIDG
jgi:hypothetical protein